jgi:hypothetical protein
MQLAISQSRDDSRQYEKLSWSLAIPSATISPSLVDLGMASTSSHRWITKSGWLGVLDAIWISFPSLTRAPAQC